MIDKDIILQVKHLTLARGLSALFSCLNFKVYAGHVLQSAGPNGSGKTSLLRVLAGLTEPDQGEVIGAARRVFVGHELGLNPYLTVLENIKYGLLARGQSRKRCGGSFPAYPGSEDV